MKTLDCRGLECPLPVVKTKEALKEENERLKSEVVAYAGVDADSDGSVTE